MVSEEKILEMIQKSEKIIEKITEKCCDDPLCPRFLMGHMLARDFEPVVRGLKAAVNPSDAATYLTRVDEILVKIAQFEKEAAEKGVQPDAVAACAK